MILYNINLSIYRVYVWSSSLISDDKIVYYHEMCINPGSYNINSDFILNAENGKLLKEVKYPVSGYYPKFGMRSIRLLRDGKAFSPLNYGSLYY